MADIINVSALTTYVRSLLESDPNLSDIAIRGEISNMNHHFKTGHRYFTLKDGKASVKAVMFRSDAERLSFRPEDGMCVIARCRVSLYERDGAFQLYVDHLFPEGVGSAQMAFEQLRARLAAEGLFAEEEKKPMPAFPGRIGLVTSKTGAALQDILKVAQRRCPLAHFLLAPVTVQGANAPDEIAEAITRLDQSGLADMIIVARGGGSAEDLSAFNAEELARAVYACHVPVLSAVGHEVDFTILDFVADLRAPTPSAAAEMALPDMVAIRTAMMNICTSISNNMHTRLDSWYNELNRMARHPALEGVRFTPREGARRLARLSKDLQHAMGQKLESRQGRLRAAAALAGSLNPYGVLARGYGIARSEDNTVLRSVFNTKPGQLLQLTLSDGALGCRVETIQPRQEQNA